MNQGHIILSLVLFVSENGEIMENQITIRSDRDTEYTFQYKGENVTLKVGGVLSIADGLEHVVLPTTAMKIINNLIIIKNSVK